MFAMPTDVEREPALTPDAVTGLGAALDSLSALEPGELTDAELSETVVALERLRSRLEAATARITGVFDARNVFAGDGARSAASWLTHRTHRPVAAMRRQVRLAREIRTMPETEAAWAAGEISSDHVAALSRVRTEATEEAFSEAEGLLVGYATRLSFRSFHHALTFWRDRVDPDGAERDAERAHQDRRVHCSKTFEGTYRLDGELDPIGGTEFSTALSRIEDELFEADWARARAEHGEEATADKLWRTPAQRRADALVVAPGTHRGASPLRGRRSRRPRPRRTRRVRLRPASWRATPRTRRSIPATPGSDHGWRRLRRTGTIR